MRLSSLACLRPLFNGTAQEVLAQIESRDYAGPYRASGKTVIPVGLGLSAEQKGISGWVMG